MSATEDDTELRDLLIQNLDNNGVLNRLKAEMRAAVFLAMEEQDKLENKSPLINENLKKCLGTKDGRLVASLVLDFLQVFNLDFTLAVFQPEINSLNGLDSRDLVCRELSLSPSELNRNCPLLLELVKRGRHKPAEEDRSGPASTEPSQKQIAHARKTFDIYDKDGSGSVVSEDLRRVFTDLFPGLSRNMLNAFITDELRAADEISNAVDVQMFLGLYKHLFSECRSVVVQDSDVSPVPEDRILAPDSGVSRDHVQQQVSRPTEEERLDQDLDLDQEDNPDEGDSFFDDPLPKPQKTYGWGEASRATESPAGSLSETSRPGPAGGGGSGVSEQSHGRNGASNSSGRSFRAPNDKSGSLHFDDVEYDDDFNSSHRSDASRSELSIGEEIEEVSIEGPDASEQLDETTQDVSASQLSLLVDYMEDVS